jgi:hypothetical protein
MAKKDSPYLERTSLIRDIYRSLLNTGRSYAAFSGADRTLFINKMTNKKYILDPMSGYGLLTNYCSDFGIQSFCLEYNMPSYLWQILCHPENVQGYINCIENLLNQKSRWPNTPIRAVISDKSFPDETLSLIKQLLDLNRDVVRKHLMSSSFEELALALLLPFTGRLSCSVRGDNSTLVKEGGICVLRNWEDDYVAYLNAVLYRLSIIKNKTLAAPHSVQFGDARSYKFHKGEFDGLFTSPPYPNHRDFVSMFKPEQELLKLLGEKNNKILRSEANDIIGSNFVSGRISRLPKSEILRDFFEAISGLKRNRNAEIDDENYYIPYFRNYFSDLEAAYENVSISLKAGFEGYIIVVNNTHRGLVIPVADFIVETWKNIGVKAEIIDKNELFHIGTKNPRARGIRARHTRYEIKIWDK